MAILQVKDCPADVYSKINLVAKEENRSIAQQTIVLLRESLHQRESNRKRRKTLLENLSEKTIPDQVKEFDPAVLIREDRDR